jgi:ArsR family metal-binding transcriptional regulator
MVVMTTETDVLAVLNGYSLDTILPCVADPEKIRVIVKIGRDLLELLPYIKGYLKKGIYLKEVPFLSFKKEGKNITLYRNSIAITKLSDEHEVVEELKHLSAIIQEVMNNRETIEPDYSYGRKINPIVLYKFTPKTNCGRCGEATCLAFVMKLINDEKTVAECPPLLTAGYEQAKKGIIEVLAE